MNPYLETPAVEQTHVDLPSDFTPWMDADVEQLIPDRFEEQVRMHSNRLAVKGSDQALTYDALNRAANRVAHSILAQSHDQQPVALLFEHNTAMVVAMLGVLKASRIYVPLAVTDPAARLRDIVADSEATLLITNRNNLVLAQALGNASASVLNIDELDPSLPDENPLRQWCAPDTVPLSIVYTSGSTGAPKGVVQAHINVLHEMRCTTNYVRITPDDHVALLTSYTIFVSFMTICRAILNGATLVLFDTKREGIPALAPWLKQEQVSLYHSVPTVFRHLMASLHDDDWFPAMRCLMLGGEPVFRRDVELFRQHFPPTCLFRVGLGSTEAGLPTYMSITVDQELPETALPLGKASPGREVLLLDETRQPVAHGEIGEIAIKSRYVALGYWKKPEQTAATFLPAPAGSNERIYLTGDLGRFRSDGNLEHAGRKDLQVKIRGNRVEIPEIETRLLGLDGIKQAAVVAKKDRSGEHRLVAYIVPSALPMASSTTLRQSLSSLLPAYMVPAAFVCMQQLPQGTFGKIDRLALPEPDWEAIAAETAYIAPRTPVEELLAQQWAEVLELHKISIYANFFDLGGDSLRASQVIGRIGTIYHIELPVSIFFDAPTIAELSLVITQHLAEHHSDASIDQLMVELEGLGDEV